MDLKLTGKTALITGASRGIGLAIARALSAEGVRVIGAARTISAELKEITPHTFAVDLSESAAAARLVEFALAETGGIDVLVNNVGAPDTRTEGFLAIDDDGWAKVFDTNLFIAVRTTRAALPGIIERRGSVINIGSTNGRLPLPVVIDYSAAKAALLSFGKSLAEEFGPAGVRVNTVSAGPVMTDAWTGDGGIADELAKQAGLSRAELLSQVPTMLGLSTGAPTTVDEIATVVTLLASRRVDNINGSEFIIDGGLLKAV
ncbi:SDR family NAD(P)-dependent oxidoreductase [Kitasatospora sp. NPDC005856]|uniref:SDR family NAD(P)-dependent oxidoreductase n=1 Tax=Kitasatospora sp. NPDC005856 TaxID=3154566 RepID=UPI0033EE2AFD